MSLSAYSLVLLGSTVVLSALWAAILLVLVQLREQATPPAGAGRRHLGVEIAWAVIPAIMVLSVVVPALQAGQGASEVPAVAEAPTAR